MGGDHGENIHEEGVRGQVQHRFNHYFQTTVGEMGVYYSRPRYRYRRWDIDIVNRNTDSTGIIHESIVKTYLFTHVPTFFRSNRPSDRTNLY